MEQLITDAIANKNLIEFVYNDHSRLIEPHVLGVNNGVMQILGYQVGGSSTSGLVLEWRRFDLPKISRLQTSLKTFSGPRPLTSAKYRFWDQKIKSVT